MSHIATHSLVNLMQVCICRAVFVLQADTIIDFDGDAIEDSTSC